MKKIFRLMSIICVSFLICFTITNLTKKSDTTVSADGLYTAVKDDSGTTIYYRNSSEAVMRLTEYNYPTQNLRAAWVSLFISSLASYQSEEQWKSAYTTVLDTMESYGLNCVIFHVRTHNNALYKSELNPIATWFSNVNFDEFDPLEWAIEATHNRGMEFHAWLNPYRVNDSYCAEDYPSVNPASDASNILTSGSSKILDPGIPSVRQFIVDTCMEVVENYDVDAIHFDDYFYISGVDDSATRAKYNTENLSIADFRRKQVDLFIEELSKELRAYNAQNNKCVQLGISPSGIYQNGSYVTTPTYDDNGNLTSPLYSDTSGFAHYGDYLYSDTLNWINNEWIDYIMPQTYWSIEHTAASFAALTRWWSWAVKNKNVNLYVGLGIYMPTQSGSSATYWQKNTNEIRDQILNAEMYDEIGGISLYSYNYIQNSNKYIKTGMDLLKTDYFSTKIPCDVKKYYASIIPSVAVTTVSKNDNTISWLPVENVRGYMVYKVPVTSALNKDDITQVYYYGTATEVSIDDDDNYVYYVSTVNLANVISEATMASHEVSSTYVVEQIDKVPSNLSVDEAAILDRIMDLYKQLSDEDKGNVTNYQKLLDLYSLIETKNNALSEVVNYASSSNYSIETWNIILQYRKLQQQEIDNATTNSQINEYLASYKAYVDSYPDVTTELKPIKQAAYATIDNLYNALELEYYTAASKTEIERIYTLYTNNIKTSKSSTSINEYVTEFTNKLALISSFKPQYNERMNYAKKYLKEYLEFIADNYTWYNDYESLFIEYLDSLYQDLSSLDKEEFYNNYLDLSKEYCDYIDQYALEVKELKRTIDIQLTLIDSYSDKKEGAAALKASYTDKIKAAKTVDEATALFDEFQDEYKNLGKTSQTTPVETPVTSSSCGSLGINIVSLLSSISIIALIINRKRH